MSTNTNKDNTEWNLINVMVLQLISKYIKHKKISELWKISKTMKI